MKKVKFSPKGICLHPRPEGRGFPQINDKKRYPDNWKEIRESILKRAKNRCEWPDCGVENYSMVVSKATQKVIKVILTIAHLDHTPENCNEDNLKAWCQLHHNRYDAPMRAINRKINKQKEKK